MSIQPPGSRFFGSPTPATGRTIANYPTYAAAAAAVDYLSDEEFAVQHVSIVGTDLQLVERVTGRLTYPKVALNGAASGAQFGLLVGLVMAFVGEGQDLMSSVATGIGLGAAIGIMLGIMTHAASRGKRDFTSASQVVASNYAVMCEAEHASAAEAILRAGGAPHAAGLRAAGRPQDNTELEGASQVRTEDGGTPLTYSEALDRRRREARDAGDAEH